MSNKKTRTLEEIVATEAEYHNEGKLDRTRIKMLRRHAFHYSYKREAIIFDQLIKNTFEGKEILEIGSHSWKSWIKGRARPKKLTCINISQQQLEAGSNHADKVDFPIDFHLMDANNLTFPDESFEVVYGGAILHHLDIEMSVGHIHRVLKPGGKIIFLEPLNMNPLYKLWRKLNPKERTPDEHALVSKDFKFIRSKFTFEHYFFDFFSVFTGFVSLKLYGDKNYDNWLNKFGHSLDVGISKVNFLHPLFARTIIYGEKK
jgi:ubiquinone/menaquinone biosynthesis C-methylase UbiE